MALRAFDDLLDDMRSCWRATERTALRRVACYDKDSQEEKEERVVHAAEDAEQAQAPDHGEGC